jgi:hypothetical protein
VLEPTSEYLREFCQIFGPEAWLEVVGSETGTDEAQVCVDVLRIVRPLRTCGVHLFE